MPFPLFVCAVLVGMVTVWPEPLPSVPDVPPLVPPLVRYMARSALAHSSSEVLPSAGNTLTPIEAELKILEITQLRILDGQRRSDAADPRSSILKLKGVELRQAASELLLAAAGPAALEVRHDDAPFDQDGSEWLGTIMPNYGILRAASIYGGSSEVQKGILAKSQLGV